MLKFIGNGSAFNTALGNNSAYIKKGDCLFMIDCGSTVFSQMISNEVLKDTRRVVVAITHLHPDHIGSLGDLIFYMYYTTNHKLTILVPHDVIMHDLVNILKLQGIGHDLYDMTPLYLDNSSTIQLLHMDIELEPILTEHAKEIQTYAYILKFAGKTIFYSADNISIPDGIMDMFERGDIDIWYQDMSSAHYEGRVHMSIKDAEELFPLELRDRVWAMHLDNGFDEDYVKSLGFNVTNNNKGVN